MGNQGIQEQKARRPGQAPSTRGLWPGQDAEQDGQPSARVQSPESCRAYKLGSLSHEGHKQKLQIQASISERSVWLLHVRKKRWTGEPIKVAPEKKKIQERGEMGMGQGSRENGKKDCSWIFFFLNR